MATWRGGKMIRAFISEVGADAVYWHRSYSAAKVTAEDSLYRELKQQGCDARLMKSELLVEPWDFETRFYVLHDYMQAWMNLPPPPRPLPPPKLSREHAAMDESIPLLDVDDLGLVTSKERDDELLESWNTGSDEATDKLASFLDGSFLSFGEGRSRRDIYGTSRLSPHLRFGEVSPRQVYHSIRGKMGECGGSSNIQQEVDRVLAASKAYLKNLCAREFAHHLLYYNPNAVSVPLVPEFNMFPWNHDPGLLAAWQAGRTGYPLVDAAMRELSKTGWVHNILRFLLATFLTKYLLLPWQVGMASFHELLVDGDLTLNVLGWQWACGCNSDSLPITSLINPVGLGRKQDPTGFYVRKWLPELGKLPDKYIHCPWKASASVLRDAGVTLGVDFPFPIIYSKEARHNSREAVLIMKRILHGNHPSRFSLIQSSEIDSDVAHSTAERQLRNEVIPKLWNLKTSAPEPLVDDLSKSHPLLRNSGARVAILNTVGVRNDVSGLTQSKSIAPTTNGRSARTDDGSVEPPTKVGRETLSLRERKEIVRRIVLDSAHEFHNFAVHISRAYELTDSIDRCTSKDYVRLCTLRDEYHRTANLTGSNSKITIYKMKRFFGKVLKLEVTGEWDRHNHGGVRGPYVYGIRSLSHSNSTSSQ